MLLALVSSICASRQRHPGWRVFLFIQIDPQSSLATGCQCQCQRQCLFLPIQTESRLDTVKWTCFVYGKNGLPHGQANKETAFPFTDMGGLGIGLSIDLAITNYQPRLEQYFEERDSIPSHLKSITIGLMKIHFALFQIWGGGMIDSWSYCGGKHQNGKLDGFSKFYISRSTLLGIGELF